MTWPLKSEARRHTHYIPNDVDGYIEQTDSDKTQQEQNNIRLYQKAVRKSSSLSPLTQSPGSEMLDNGQQQVDRPESRIYLKQYGDPYIIQGISFQETKFGSQGSLSVSASGPSSALSGHCTHDQTDGYRVLNISVLQPPRNRKFNLFHANEETTKV